LALYLLRVTVKELDFDVGKISGRPPYMSSHFILMNKHCTWNFITYTARRLSYEV